jgi:hypothetical protein
MAPRQEAKNFRLNKLQFKFVRPALCIRAMRFVSRDILAEECRPICAKQRLNLVVSWLGVWLFSWLFGWLLVGYFVAWLLQWLLLGWLVGLLGDWLSGYCLVD